LQNTALRCYRLGDHIVLSRPAVPFREAEVFVISLNNASSSLGMHACFQTGCHDSIGLNPAWEDSGFVLSRQEGGLLPRACWELRARWSGFVAQRLPTDLLRVVIICLLHPIKHASVQTINSKEDIDELSSTRSRIGARMRDAGARLSIP
jgi:hypothetical protein